MLIVAACDSRDDGPSARPIVVYCSVDEAFARPLLAEFEKSSGLRVRPKFDTEAGKTTGLVESLRAEKRRPVADVWWSSEIFGTIELARDGVLVPFRPAGVDDIPAQFRDPGSLWTAFAARGRVVAYDPRRTAPNDLPKRWADFADPRFKGRVAMANPAFGTTRGHMAAMLAAWGEPAFRGYLEALGRNEAKLAGGNAQTVFMVARGQADFGWTDTDDVLVAQQRGDSLAMIYPDMDSPDGGALPGTLWIPNSAGLVAGGPNPDAGRRLLEFIVSPLVEEKLSQSTSGNVPVRSALRAKLSLDAPPCVDIDFAESAAALEKSDALCREILIR
ncbi:MAG: extracellular solute-binding protein [Phycisphaerae bacterium]|nr:extracellular solute-binding protein [Phycisphaerae bacterium]